MKKVVLCDPIKRLISHVKHGVSWKIDDKLKFRYGLIARPSATSIDLETIRRTREKIKGWFRKDGSTEFTAANLAKGLGADRETRFLRYGNYATSLRG